MSGEQKEITIKVNRGEYNLLQFIRTNGYMRCTLECIGGEPVKVFQPLKSIRLDLKEITEIENEC